MPVLVEDVRSDPRYLNALTRCAASWRWPMMARGRLVGVLDVQSTRVKAYSEQDRALDASDSGARRGGFSRTTLGFIAEWSDRIARCATLAHLSQEFSSILDLDELLGKIRGDHTRANQLRRVQYLPCGH